MIADRDECGPGMRHLPRSCRCKCRRARASTSPIATTSRHWWIATLERWGRIDILAANAGVYPHIPFAELTPGDFDELMAINVRGAVFAAQACSEPMRDRRYGRIVLTSSITGPITGQPGYAHYGASKAAMLGFMRSAAVELANAGITVNAVLPGNVRTPGFGDLGEEHQRAMLAAIPLGSARRARRRRLGRAVPRLSRGALHHGPNLGRRRGTGPARERLRTIRPPRPLGVPELCARVHRRLDDIEIAARDLEQTEAKHIAPSLLVLDETEGVDQRTDRGFIASHKLEVAAPRRESWSHFDLIGLFVSHATDGSECLQRFTTSQACLRRIEDEPVSDAQPFESRRLPVASLRKATVNARPNVITADCVHPALHAVWPWLSGAAERSKVVGDADNSDQRAVAAYHRYA